MKRNIIVFTLVAAVTAGANGVWAAGDTSGDQPVRDMDCRCLRQERRMPPPPLSPEEHVERMACLLKLTNEQQIKIKAMLEKDRVTTAPLLQKLEESGKKLREAARGAAFDETVIRAIAVRQAQAEADLTVSRARMRTQVNALLSPDQRLLADKITPPFLRGHGPRPPYDDERGPDQAPPPPCRDHWSHHPGDECDGD
ncbi:MAG: Spy/CpxP family protein refolding chaperone [Desulfuromonadales bacterium]|nr:Spy/CpxP family protein refolding chaperone [Desulfuromonadales bacterium]